MKKSTIISLILVIALVVLGVWYGLASKTGSNSSGGSKDRDEDKSGPAVDATETVKVSNTLSAYQNAELGFSVNYPNEWEAEDANSGVTFIMPVDKDQVSTIGTLQAVIEVTAGTCAFPPVTTVKDRGTLKSGDFTFNTISMSNTVQGRSYFNRIYSLQQGDICYKFSFASITLSPSSKGLVGSNIVQAENNNKALVNTADAAFIDMVKSFKLISGPQGIDESVAAPVKK